MSRPSMILITRWLRRPVAGLALAIVIAACGSAPGPGTSGAPAGSVGAASRPPAASVGAGGATPVVNCQTISGEAIGTILGMDLAEANPFGDLSCTWTFKDKASGVNAGSIQVRWSNDDVSLGGTKNAFPGGEDVSIGDRGYWAAGPDILYVAKGAHAYAIDVSGLDESARGKEIATQVAELLLPVV
jgi:hypothetical protein